MRTAVIIDVVRTGSGRGKLGGALAGVHPAELLATTLRALLDRTGIDPAKIEDVLGGCVTQVGEQSVNITRTAALAAGLPESVPATTIDRQCGSSQQAVHFAAHGIVAGAYDVAIACGVESMSRAPLTSALGPDSPWLPLGTRYGDVLIDQGVSAELVAAQAGLTREELDAYAARSHQLATEHLGLGDFDNELVAVDTPAGGTHLSDETVRSATTIESLSKLQPVFVDPQMQARYPDISWSVTAGNSSPLTDGASAALIVEESIAAKLGLKPRARLAEFAVVGSDPITMLTGVIPATHRVLERAGKKITEIDAYEVNEAFASVPLAWAREFDADTARLNPCGGAIALGHPLGASGTRILATLVNHLERSGQQWGLQTMCERGGMANAMLVERL